MYNLKSCITCFDVKIEQVGVSLLEVWKDPILLAEFIRLNATRMHIKIYMITNAWP